MDSNTEWVAWGERDPLYAVAVWQGRQRGGERPWTDEEFYELGRSDWEDFRARWERYGLDPASCVEIGCGAGRLTKQLARSFGRVVALDVSPGMLDYARGRVDAGNVEFVLADGGTIPVADGAVGAVFSTHVFQHLDSPSDAERYLREIHRVLAPGGTMMVHLPVHRLPPGMERRFVRAGRQLAKLADDLRAARERMRIRRGESSPLMRFLSFDLDWIEETLTRVGFADPELAAFPVASNGAWHAFVLGRRA